MSDQINGGAGNDTLKIFSDGAVALPAGLSNVENIYINDTVHQDYNVSTTALAAVKSLELAGGATVNNATITLTVAAGQSLTLTDVVDGDDAADGNDGDVALAAAASVTAMTVNLVRVGAQTGLSATNDVDFDVTGTGVTTLNVAATGVNNTSLANTGAALATVNVSGAGSLAIQGTTATTITKFDASANTGGVTVDLSASTGANQTITGGSGADTITVDLGRNITIDGGAGNDVITFDTGTVAGDLSSTAGSADSIKGGEGTDTLAMTAATADSVDGAPAADRAVITGFERIRITTDLNGTTVNAAQFSGGVNYVQLGADTTTANGTISGVTSGATIENRANTHAGSTLTVGGTFEAGDLFNVTIRGTTVTATAVTDNTGTAAAIATAINTQFGAGTATSAGAVVTLATNVATAFATTEADGSAADNQTATLATGDAIETDVTMTGATGAGTPDDLLNIFLNGNITNNDNVESAYGVSGINKLVITTADRDNTDGTTDRNDGYIVNLTNDNSVTLINAKGTSALAFASTASTASLATFDATELSGDLSVNLTTNGLTQGVSVTGGSGTNTIAGTGFGDVINGGARADTITGAGGADVMTGGGGADVFVFTNTSTGTPTAANFDTITDFAKASDIIQFASIAIATSVATAQTGQAAVNSEGIATFATSDNTLTLKLTAVAGAVTAGTTAAGETVIFEHDGNSYVFISDGTNGLSATDVLIKLTGVTGLTDSTISGNNLTIA